MFFCVSYLREKLHARKKTKPILKNSTGESEKSGRRIQRFAPPALLARFSGRKCMMNIKNMQPKNSRNPSVWTILSGLPLEMSHINVIPRIPEMSWRTKKWNWLVS